MLKEITPQHLRCRIICCPSVYAAGNDDIIIVGEKLSAARVGTQSHERKEPDEVAIAINETYFPGLRVDLLDEEHGPVIHENGKLTITGVRPTAEEFGEFQKRVGHFEAAVKISLRYFPGFSPLGSDDAVRAASAAAPPKTPKGRAHHVACLQAVRPDSQPDTRYTMSRAAGLRNCPRLAV